MAERPIHLVGGVPLEAREVFELAGASFGPLAKRLPDGEKKRGWLRPQAPIIGRAAGMIPGGLARYLHMTNQRIAQRPARIETRSISGRSAILRQRANPMRFSPLHAPPGKFRPARVSRSACRRRSV
jgi:hypothetical protein